MVSFGCAPSDGGIEEGRLTPGCNKRSQVEGRAQSLHEDVHGNIQNNVGDEEDEQGDIVIAAGHVEVGLESLNSRIADVGAVEEGNDQEQAEHGHEVEIHPDSDLVLGFMVDILERCELFDLDSEMIFLEIGIFCLRGCMTLRRHGGLRDSRTNKLKEEGNGLGSLSWKVRRQRMRNRNAMMWYVDASYPSSQIKLSSAQCRYFLGSEARG